MNSKTRWECWLGINWVCNDFVKNDQIKLLIIFCEENIWISPEISISENKNFILLFFKYINVYRNWLNVHSSRIKTHSIWTKFSQHNSSVWIRYSNIYFSIHISSYKCCSVRRYVKRVKIQHEFLIRGCAVTIWCSLSKSEES